MLQLAKTLNGVPVLSIRTGGVVATAVRPIINPNNLKVEGWYCTDKFSKHPLVLLSQDIREWLDQGMVVDDHDALTEPDELVRIKDIVQLNFDLVGKQVVTEGNQRVGKVNDFATEMTSLYIQKLYVVKPVYRAISSPQLSIDRNQIVEITNKKIIVRDLSEKILATAPAGAAM